MRVLKDMHLGDESVKLDAGEIVVGDNLLEETLFSTAGIKFNDGILIKVYPHHNTTSFTVKLWGNSYDKGDVILTIFQGYYYKGGNIFTNLIQRNLGLTLTKGEAMIYDSKVCIYIPHSIPFASLTIESLIFAPDLRKTDYLPKLINSVEPLGEIKTDFIVK